MSYNGNNIPNTGQKSENNLTKFKKNDLICPSDVSKLLTFQITGKSV